MFGKVYEAFLDYELILFRDVDLPPATQVAFARAFGEIQIHVMNQYQKYPEFPEIYMLTNADKDGKPTGKHPDKGTLALAHRRLVARAHRSGDHDVFGSRARRSAARPSSPTCMRPTTISPPG